MNKNINDTLLTNILKIIKVKGTSEKECLIKAGLSTSYFSDWKSGKSKNPTFDRIYRIANALEVSIDDLIADNTTMTKKTSNDLLPDEHNLLMTYREMDSLGKMLLQDQLRYLWAEHRQPSSKLSVSHENNCG